MCHTGRQICDTWVRIAQLNMSGEDFWNHSPTGELDHVGIAHDMLHEMGVPILSIEEYMVANA